MKAQRDGFSLVEVIIAMMILTVAILAMGASTGYVLTQVRSSELRTDRVAAVRQAAEVLRGEPWAALINGCGSAVDVDTGDRFTVTYECPQVRDRLARVHLISVGPGYAGRRFVIAAHDTTVINIRRRE
jgi:prepilin-type N-terminal cleavage/methylation domain-containing protein